MHGCMQIVDWRASDVRVSPSGTALVAEAAINADAERGLGEIMAGPASSAIVILVSHASM